MQTDRYVRWNRVLTFAAHAHRKQFRKGTKDSPDDFDDLIDNGVPNVMHHDAVIPGILYDVIEGAEVTREVAEREFGRRIAELFTGESEPEKISPLA